MQVALCLLTLLTVGAGSASALLTFDAEAARARPVTKVVTLLQGMKEQLESEAKEETELMEKFSCWCKENSEGKATSVESAEAQIQAMEAKVSELSATSARLAVEYKNLADDVEKNEASMDSAVEMRKKQLAQFQQDERDLLSNIQSVQNAQVVVDNDTKVSFVQVAETAVGQTLQTILSTHAKDLSLEQGQKVAMLLRNSSSEGGVDGVLQGLETDLEKSLKDLQETEKTNKAEYEKLIAAKREEIDAAKGQIATKKEQKTSADEEKMQTVQGIKDARGSMGEDLAFAKEVKEKCAAKAQEWEKRQKTRAAETESVTKAIETLGADEAHEVFGKTLSFLEVSSRSAEKAASVLRAVKDERVRTLALEAKLDTFTVVKEKIDAMVGALKNETAAEVKKKDYCLEEFQQNKLANDKKQRLLSNLDAKKEELLMKMQAATEDLATLQSDIKELQKQQTLASENREKENKEFQKVVSDQRTTQDLLKKALKVLGEFYNKQEESLLQQEASPKEPKTFRSYQKSSSSNGVMLMLQQLVGEAEEMEREATSAETESQADYEAFGKDTAKTLEKKARSLADKEDLKAKTEEQLLQTKTGVRGAKADVRSLETTKLELHESCDWTLANFDARQKARSEEVEALYEAKAALSGAKL